MQQWVCLTGNPGLQPGGDAFIQALTYSEPLSSPSEASYISQRRCRTWDMYSRGHQLTSFCLKAALNGMFIASEESVTVTAHCFHFGEVSVSFCAK